jgi:chromosome segregation ATPase
VFVVLGATDRPTAQAQPTHAPGVDRLYQEMQERIRYLEEQVEEEREARRRADTLLARLMDRLPEIEPPAEASPEARGEPETAAEELERVDPRTSAAQRPTEGVEHDASTLQEWSGDVQGRGRPQEATQRPWWRRVLGR